MSGCGPAVVPVRAPAGTVTTNNQTNTISENKNIAVTNNQQNSQ
jgi:hypothetical protein